MEQGPVCVLQRRGRCFSAWLWGIHLGDGEQGHFQPELVRSSLKRKREASCPESQRALELLTVTELTVTVACHLSLSCPDVGVIIPRVNIGNRSQIWISGV